MKAVITRAGRDVWLLNAETWVTTYFLDKWHWTMFYLLSHNHHCPVRNVLSLTKQPLIIPLFLSLGYFISGKALGWSWSMDVYFKTCSDSWKLQNTYYFDSLNCTVRFLIIQTSWRCVKWIKTWRIVFLVHKLARLYKWKKNSIHYSFITQELHSLFYIAIHTVLSGNISQFRYQTNFNFRNCVLYASTVSVNKKN